MTIDISDLIANVRAWHEALEVFDRADERWNDCPEEQVERAWESRIDALDKLNKSAAWYTSEWHKERKTLRHLVALADHCERLQARIDAALVICDTNYTDSKGEYRDGVNAARDEIYDVLTGEEPK